MFEVGDIVRIRSWDDLVSEFGTDSAGDILLPNVGWLFQSDKDCYGKLAEVTETGPDNGSWMAVDGENFSLVVPKDAVELLRDAKSNQFNDEDWHELLGL